MDVITILALIVAVINAAYYYRHGDSRQRWFKRVLIALWLSAAALLYFGYLKMALVFVLAALGGFLCAWQLKAAWAKKRSNTTMGR